MIDFSLNGEHQGMEMVNNIYTLPYPCGENHEDCFPYYWILPAGSYRLQVWGASGGTTDQNYIGYGGYSEGILSLTQQTEAYFYVGASGTSVGGSSLSTSKSFNGGGIGRSGTASTMASSGGGASDVRLLFDSLYQRVIVAGGGGGTCKDSSGAFFKGGNGGSNEGIAGEGTYSLNFGGFPGTQFSGGLSSQDQQNGIFGVGGDRTAGNGGGGGGGWFGGGSGGHSLFSGGGGSGFIYTSSHCNNSLPSEYFLVDASTNYQTTITGHGQIQIEYLGHKVKKSTTLGLGLFYSCLRYLRILFEIRIEIILIIALFYNV